MSDMISANAPSLAERYEQLSRDFAVVFGERNDAIKERDELREALTGMLEAERRAYGAGRKARLHFERKYERFIALANLNKTDGE